MEIQETNIAKAILEKYTVFECTLLDLKTYIKVKVVQRIGIDTRINKQVNETEQSPEAEPSTYSYII